VRRARADPGCIPMRLTAEAVLFTDEAELVACLVRDWLRGWVCRAVVVAQCALELECPAMAPTALCSRAASCSCQRCRC